MSRKLIIAALTAIALAVGGNVTAASPAEAASASMPKGCSMSAYKVKAKTSGKGKKKKVKVVSKADGYCTSSTVWALNVKMYRQIDYWPNSLWREGQDSESDQGYYQKSVSKKLNASSTCKKPKVKKLYTLGSYYRTGKQGDVTRQSKIKRVKHC